VKPLELPLARAGIDRAGELRQRPAELEQLWESGRILHLADGKFATSGTTLAFLTAAEIAGLHKASTFYEGEKIFLGQLDGVGYFAWCTQSVQSESESADATVSTRAIEALERFKTLREIGDDLSDLEIGLAVHSQALANWHHTHRFCPKCGATTTSSNGGSVRRCDVDGSEHYPRTDPAMIVLVTDRADRILLGRQKVWVEGRYSNFAGFVDAGESFERCVAREVMEEANLPVSEISYLGSQPWPFPASIMIAFSAVTDSPELAKPDGEEIVDIRWFSRAELSAAVADGSLNLPPVMSVSRKMIEAWYGQPINS
jgi:NAD+ diphosphatase